MKTGVIIQARMGSERLPAKVMADIEGKPLLYHVIKRVQMSKKVGKIVLATTTMPVDDVLVQLAVNEGASVFRGSAEDVLGRFIDAAQKFGLEAIIRITGDCPLLCSQLIDEAVDTFERQDADYTFVKGYPRGTGDVEIITLRSMLITKAQTRESETYYREHVMPYLTEHPDRFKLNIVPVPAQFKRDGYRLCVDTPEDLEVARKVYAYFSPRRDFSLQEILGYLDQNPQVLSMNRSVEQRLNEL